jgi:tetratricopeptide (TPR) repeat protein
MSEKSLTEELQSSKPYSRSAGVGSDVLLRITIIVLAVLIVFFLALLIRGMFQAERRTPRTSVERELIYWQSRVKANPKDARAHDGLGTVFFTEGNYYEALREYKLAIKYDKNFHQARYNMAITYEKLGRKNEALKLLKEVQKGMPTFEPALYEAGKIYYSQKRYNKAAKVLGESVAMVPDGADAHYLLGLVYRAQGKKDMAIYQFKEALKYIPDYEKAQKALDKLLKSKK